MKFYLQQETFKGIPKILWSEADIISLKKEYERLVKYKEHSFREAILNKISDLEGNNPKVFWEVVNELKSNKDKNLADNIEPQEWHDWLKNYINPSLLSTNQTK